MSCDSLRKRLEARLDPVASWTPERTAIRSDFWGMQDKWRLIDHWWPPG